MAFGLAPGAPFTDGISVVPANWLNFVSSNFPNALDAIGGGTYALLAGHTWTMSGGSGNVIFNVDFSANSINSAFFNQGSSVDSRSQAWLFGTDSITTFQGTAGHSAVLNFDNHSSTIWFSGALIGDAGTWTRSVSETWVSGSAVQFGGATTWTLDSASIVNGTAGHEATWIWGAHSTITDAGTWTHSAAHTISAGVWAWGGGTTVLLDGTTVLGATQPSATADPGGNNLLFSTNIAKSWGNIHVTGSGTATISDGYNVATATIVGQVVEITLVRPVANSNYSLAVSALSGTTASITICNIVSTSVFQIAFYVGLGIATSTKTDLSTTAVDIMFQLYARQ